MNIYFNNYQIDQKLKYLVYFTGNFSPPHKGHVYMIEKFIDYKNVSFLISMVEDTKRHNIDLDVTMKIWEIYQKEIFKEKKMVFIKEKDCENYLKNIKKIDYILYIRGNENINKQYITSIKNKYKNLEKHLRGRGILFDYLFIDRIPNISSSLFCKNPDISFLPDIPSKHNILFILKNK